MAKINIILNNKTYSIDESVLASAAAELKAHLSTVMNGSGATINLGGVTYNVDSAKLSTATNEFVSHLGTIAGEGKKIVVGGVELSVDSTKLGDFISDMSNALNDLVSSGSGSDSDELSPGLYETGSNYTVMKTSWDDLENSGIVHIVGDEDLPEKNEYGFYYGVEYSMTMEGMTIRFTFNKDGSAIYDEAGNLGEIPTGVFVYGDHIIDMSAENMPVFEVSADGTSFSGEGFTFSVGNDFPSKGTVYVATIDGETPMLAGDLVLPDDGRITSIGSFKGQSSLSGITIPDSITAINKNAFSGCSSLDKIIFNGTTAQWNEIPLGSYWNKNVPAAHVQCSDGNVAIPEEVFGFPISWNSMEVMGNPSVLVGGETPMVKVSDFIPTAEDFAGTELTVMTDTCQCEGVQEMLGLVLAEYADGNMLALSVATAGEYAELGVTFAETGLYVLDYGLMGEDFDFMISLPIPTLATPVISLENKILTITPVENATSYKIYIDGEFVCDTTETTVDLTEQLIPLEQAVEIFVYATPPEGYKSSMTSLEYMLPTLDKPEVSLLSKILTVIPVENATGYEVYNIDDELICTTTETTVDLSNKLSDDYSDFIMVRSIYPGSYFPSEYEYVWFSLTEPAPGLYDINDTLLATWPSLINNYHLNITQNYTNNNFTSSKTLLRYVLDNNEELSASAKLIIPKSVSRIGDFALNYCTSLTNVVIPNSVTSIGRSAFVSCTSLANIIIPNSVTSIDINAFAICKNLTSVVIGNGVTQINESTFNDCRSLESVTIPASITYIGRSAFHWCTKLTNISFEGTIEQWNSIDKDMSAGMSWNTKVPATYVQCSDGQVAL